MPNTIDAELPLDPIQGDNKITSGGGPRIHDITGLPEIHGGIDISSNDPHQPVSSTGEGEVVFTGYNTSYGNYVVVKYDEQYGGGYGLYAHMKNGSIKVERNQKVTAGQDIGEMGSTGRSTKSHLHYEYRTESEMLNNDGSLKLLRSQEERVAIGERTANRIQHSINIPKNRPSRIQDFHERIMENLTRIDRNLHCKPALESLGLQN
jgi:murein DD-endopeptidase MepM/ murein hydrolase activator NlpD